MTWREALAAAGVDEHKRYLALVEAHPEMPGDDLARVAQQDTQAIALGLLCAEQAGSAWLGGRGSAGPAC